MKQKLLFFILLTFLTLTDLKLNAQIKIGNNPKVVNPSAHFEHNVAFDNMGNESNISPHNFSLIGEPIGPMAWSYYSKNISKNMQVNVDMMKLALLVERLSGQKLVYRSDLEGNHIEQKINTEVTFLEKEIKNLKLQNQKYKNALNHLIKRIESLEGVSDQ